MNAACQAKGGRKVNSLKRIKASTMLAASIGVVISIAGLVAILTINWQMKTHALREAREKARIHLDRNLSTHTYFSHQLKPAVFSKIEPFVEKAYFDPAWMSSTYAIREIDKYYKFLSETDNYYKEAAINARSPENEADAFEQAFIRRLNQFPDLTEHALVREIDGKPFFVVLRRGEIMEKDCLRCHSTPEKAPADLVAYYGPERSFQRHEGETVSTISIRIPLQEAYSVAKDIFINLSVLFGLTLMGVFGLSVFLSKNWVFEPLYRIRKKAAEISQNPEYLGEQIDLPLSRELNDLTSTFNLMSQKLGQERNQLESRVIERTKELNDVNQELEKEVGKHKQAVSRLETSLAEIKTLRGILPVCSHCKNIRNDDGYWDQIESYIAEHSEADISHSICPNCAKKYYPDYDIYKE